MICVSLYLCVGVIAVESDSYHRNSAVTLNLSLSWSIFILHFHSRPKDQGSDAFCVGSRLELCVHTEVETWMHTLLVWFLKRYKCTVHPSIHPLSTIELAIDGSDTWWQQARKVGQIFFCPAMCSCSSWEILRLTQVRWHIIPPVCSGSALGLLPVGHAWNTFTSARHPTQMSGPPQLALRCGPR